jgi:beta-N-acetylglucosaminidase
MPNIRTASQNSTLSKEAHPTNMTNHFYTSDLSWEHWGSDFTAVISSRYMHFSTYAKVYDLNIT